VGENYFGLSSKGQSKLKESCLQELLQEHKAVEIQTMYHVSLLCNEAHSSHLVEIQLDKFIQWSSKNITDYTRGLD